MTISTARQAEEAYAFASTLDNRDEQAAALLVLADQIERAAWSAHVRPVVLEISQHSRRKSEELITDGADVLSGLDSLAASGRLSVVRS